MKLEHLNTNKNTGFKIPDDYFSKLDDHILNQVNLESKLTSSGFKVDDEYFDTLETSVFNKLKEDHSATKVIPIKRNTWLYASSIAATLLLLFSLTFFNKNSFTIDNVNNETLETYILNQDINASEMASLITLDDTAFEEEILEESISDITIETYLEYTIEIEDLLIDN